MDKAEKVSLGKLALSLLYLNTLIYLDFKPEILFFIGDYDLKESILWRYEEIPEGYYGNHGVKIILLMLCLSLFSGTINECKDC